MHVDMTQILAPVNDTLVSSRCSYVSMSLFLMIRSFGYNNCGTTISIVLDFRGSRVAAILVCLQCRNPSLMGKAFEVRWIPHQTFREFVSETDSIRYTWAGAKLFSLGLLNMTRFVEHLAW